MSEFTEHVYQKFNLPMDMASVFGQLSGQERAILWLAHVEEMSHKEIGSILGVKEKSVRVLLFRARRKLAGALQSAGLGRKEAG